MDRDVNSRKQNKKSSPAGLVLELDIFFRIVDKSAVGGACKKNETNNEIKEFIKLQLNY